MEAKNIKTRSQKSAKSEIKVPTCPQCGNKEMNYYLTQKKVWKCSKAHLHGNCLVVQESLKNVA